MSGQTLRSRRAAPRPAIDRMALRYFVYRLHDEAGAALYVGRSCDPVARIRAHHSDAASSYIEDAARKALWFFDVRSVSMIGPFTWDKAVRVERDEIERLQPCGNRDLTTRDRRPAIASRSAARAS